MTNLSYLKQLLFKPSSARTSYIFEDDFSKTELSSWERICLRLTSTIQLFPHNGLGFIYELLYVSHYFSKVLRKWGEMKMREKSKY